jgi:putative transcriptional regulator
MTITKTSHRNAKTKAVSPRPRPAMSDELFAELRASVQQGGAMLRGVREPSREYTVTPRGQRPGASRTGEPAGAAISKSARDVAALRARFKLSQVKFAALLGISTATVRNWEQGRRMPEGAARVLLQVAAQHPEAVLSVVAHATSTRTAISRRSA